MMKNLEEKVWIVLEHKSDGTAESSVYDNEADANNFFIEMQARNKDPKNVRIEESVLIRRSDINEIDSDDGPWGTLRLDVNTEFVEGLMEEMAPPRQIRPGAAERFVNEKIDSVRRRARDRFERIVEEEMKEALRTSMEDWCGRSDMEY